MQVQRKLLKWSEEWSAYNSGEKTEGYKNTKEQVLGRETTYFREDGVGTGTNKYKLATNKHSL